VVCNAGVFIFEVKGWTSCAVVRQKTQAGTAQWSLRYPTVHAGKKRGRGTAA
jgi:hypothetical protein